MCVLQRGDLELFSNLSKRTKCGKSITHHVWVYCHFRMPFFTFNPGIHKGLFMATYMLPAMNVSTKKCERIYALIFFDDSVKNVCRSKWMSKSQNFYSKAEHTQKRLYSMQFNAFKLRFWYYMSFKIIFWKAWILLFCLGFIYGGCNKMVECTFNFFKAPFSMQNYISVSNNCLKCFWIYLNSTSFVNF